MSKTVQIGSPSQFSSLLSSSRIVVADFYADWCGPCKAIAPLYEQLSSQLSRPDKITFTKVNTDTQKQIAQSYSITAMPTFVIFKNAREVSRIRGANAQQLSEAVKKLAAEAESDGASSGGFGEASSSSGGSWRGAELPRGYQDVTDQVDVRGLDLLNADSDFGGARTLFESSRPSSLDSSKGKGKAEGASAGADWVESDTDEQLMLFIPFQSTLKIHSIHLTSLPPAVSEDGDEDEIPMRPKTVQLYINRAHNLGFEEADDIPATQSITIKPDDWSQQGTAKLELRFVKFQNVTSLVLFVVDGEGSGEKVRLDRIRLIGETGEKREMGKLEKVGSDD
ncbi:Thioredoxin-like protein 1 [Coniosporium apollinis]|uniref:Thioredoxin-like protein 1 n=2 Tax=Coniosporium TaxID=2810619 RepID=A0ABQ9NJP9_9PEZI|nr:Thioredoxin-like protein 1 [Cladosporium sp. JES 115]KAJ9659210.1 Thioredoxin-like protein 1 [Coniosporium apollinis]